MAEIYQAAVDLEQIYLAAGMRLDLATAGQFTGGTPVMRPEQISLDGSDALSAFPFRAFNANQVVTLRGELSRPSATPALEVARGFTDLAGVRQGLRINLVAATAF